MSNHDYGSDAQYANATAAEQYASQLHHQKLFSGMGPIGAGSILGATQPPPPKTEAKLFDQINGKLIVEAERAAEVATMLERLGDRIFGCSKLDQANATGSGGEDYRQPAEQEIWKTATQLENAINRILQAAIQLDRLA